MTLLRTLRWSLLVTVLALIGTLVYAGVKVVMLVLILSILEISFSFDNAVVNATVLRRMSKLWQSCSAPSARSPFWGCVWSSRAFGDVTAHFSPASARFGHLDPDRYR